MLEPHEFLGGVATGQFLRTTLRGLAPSLLISVAGTLLIYSRCPRPLGPYRWPGRSSCSSC